MYQVLTLNSTNIEFSIEQNKGESLCHLHLGMKSTIN